MKYVLLHSELKICGIYRVLLEPAKKRLIMRNERMSIISRKGLNLLDF